MNIGTLNPICYYFFFRNQCLLSCLCLLSSLFSFDKSKARARAPSHVLLLASACLVSRRPAPLKLIYPTLSQTITHSISGYTPSQAVPKQVLLKLYPLYLKPGSCSSFTLLYLKQQVLLKLAKFHLLFYSSRLLFHHRHRDARLPVETKRKPQVLRTNHRPKAGWVIKTGLIKRLHTGYSLVWTRSCGAIEVGACSRETTE